jgi:hypothetical protein
MNIPTHYKQIVHKFPSQKELQDFTTDRFISCLNYIEHFIEFRNDSKGFNVDSYNCSEDRRMQMEKFLEIPNHHFHEWIYRVDSWAATDNHLTFFHRLRILSRLILINLKQHPSKITPEIKEILDKYPKRMSWALANYKIVSTSKGDVVVADTLIEDEKGVRPAPGKLPSVQIKMANALLKVADIYETLAESITHKGIRDMETKDKIKALGSLSFIFQMANKKGGNHFTQININGDSKSLEKDMLEYVKRNIKE